MRVLTDRERKIIEHLIPCIAAERVTSEVYNTNEFLVTLMLCLRDGVDHPHSCVTYRELDGENMK